MSNKSIKSKQHLKSALLKTRKTIKKKFRKLYNDRITQERSLEEKYGPINKKITELNDSIKTKENILNAQRLLDNDNNENIFFNADDEDESMNDLDYNVWGRFPHNWSDDDNNNSELNMSISETAPAEIAIERRRKPRARLVHRQFRENDEISQMVPRRTQKRRGENNLDQNAKILRQSAPENNVEIPRRRRGYKRRGEEIFDGTVNKKNRTNGRKRAASGYDASDETTPKKRNRLIERYLGKRPALDYDASDEATPRKKIRLTRGDGLEKEFIPYTENIAYEYYDDPNELCERLQLLISSKLAGNSNHSQEINSIIEELRENDIIE